MNKNKKKIDVHDLKPSKDAKGGGRRGHNRREGGGHGQAVNGLNTAGRGKHYQQ